MIQTEVQWVNFRSGIDLINIKKFIQDIRSPTSDPKLELPK
jgi:hypothetical protein